MGNYQASYKLAQEAYTIDHYNRMAFTILTQSKNNIKYQKYIKEAVGYYKKIDKLTNKKLLLKDDRIRIVMMCKVVIDDYDSIIRYKTDFTDVALIKKATSLRNKFQIILDSLQQR